MSPRTEEILFRAFVFVTWPVIAAFLAVSIAIALVGAWFYIPFLPLVRVGPYRFKYREASKP